MLHYVSHQNLIEPHIESFPEHLPNTGRRFGTPVNMSYPNNEGIDN